jgi:hypothetical protein
MLYVEIVFEKRGYQYVRSRKNDLHEKDEKACLTEEMVGAHVAPKNLSKERRQRG